EDPERSEQIARRVAAGGTMRSRGPWAAQHCPAPRQRFQDLALEPDVAATGHRVEPPVGALAPDRGWRRIPGVRISLRRRGALRPRQRRPGGRAVAEDAQVL